MKNLLYVITLALLLASCGTDASPEKGFQSYKSGIWTITSKTNADWDGIQQNVPAVKYTAYSDTTGDGVPVYLSDSPDESFMYMEFGKDSGTTRNDTLFPHRVRLNYTDSLMTTSFKDSANIFYSVPKVDNIKGLYPVASGQFNLLSISISIPARCTDDPISFDDKYFDLHFRSSVINGKGVILRLRVGKIKTPIKDLCREQGLM